jgi:hypothetical protein
MILFQVLSQFRLLVCNIISFSWLGNNSLALQDLLQSICLSLIVIAVYYLLYRVKQVRVKCFYFVIFYLRHYLYFVVCFQNSYIHNMHKEKESFCPYFIVFNTCLQNLPCAPIPIPPLSCIMPTYIYNFGKITGLFGSVYFSYLCILIKTLSLLSIASK